MLLSERDTTRRSSHSQLFIKSIHAEEGHGQMCQKDKSSSVTNVAFFRSLAIKMSFNTRSKVVSLLCRQVEAAPLVCFLSSSVIELG